MLEGLADLRPMLDHLWSLADEIGRSREEIDVVFTTGLPGAADARFDPAAHLDTLDRMTKMGITWNSTSVPGDSVNRAVDAIERYGAEVIGAGR